MLTGIQVLGFTFFFPNTTRQSCARSIVTEFNSGEASYGLTVKYAPPIHARPLLVYLANICVRSNSSVCVFVFECTIIDSVDASRTK
jgi:hypothetical protein